MTMMAMTTSTPKAISKGIALSSPLSRRMPATLYQNRGRFLNGLSLFSACRRRLQQAVDRRDESLAGGDRGRKLDSGYCALAAQVEALRVDAGEAPAFGAAPRRQLRQPIGLFVQLLDQALLRL